MTYQGHKRLLDINPFNVFFSSFPDMALFMCVEYIRPSIFRPQKPCGKRYQSIYILEWQLTNKFRKKSNWCTPDYQIAIKFFVIKPLHIQVIIVHFSLIASACHERKEKKYTNSQTTFNWWLFHLFFSAQIDS